MHDPSRAARAATALLLISALLAIAALLTPASSAQGNPGDDVPLLPLLVSPAAHKFSTGFDPAPTLMTVGIPLAQGWAIPEWQGRPALALTGNERFQFRTLELWPDGSVKWALGRGVVTAGNGVTPAVSLGMGFGLSPGLNLASKTGNIVAVNTGPLQAVVREQDFNVLDRVVVDGLELVKPGTSPGIAGLLPDGTPFSVAPGSVLTIVENGPAYALLRVDGTLRNGAGQGVVDFTCRLAFVHGSRDVEVTFTIRNANLARPQHTALGSLALVLQLAAGNSIQTTTALPGGAELLSTLGTSSTLYAYQAFSGAFTEEVKGSGTAWVSPIPKLSPTVFSQEGFSVVRDTQVLHASPKEAYPDPAWLNLTGSLGGATVSIRQMPWMWPASLEASGGGQISAAIFSSRSGSGHVWAWRQHESRTALFSFHKGAQSGKGQAARRHESPVLGRYADDALYGMSGVFPYDLVSVGEQNAVYSALGLNHSVSVANRYLTVCRFLPASLGGGENNHDYIEKLLMGEWLRHGTGGQWLTALDLALYKSEWQIPRSDNFHHGADPGASNPSAPHTKNVIGDDEHRYRGGIALAWRLTGDERLREALRDEAEVLPGVSMWSHERSTYQTLVALTEVAGSVPEAAASLDASLRQRLAYLTPPILDVNSKSSGFGWDALPASGARGYYVSSSQGNSEKPPGENYVTRGFITASMGPRALYRGARRLGFSDPEASAARARIVDLATYTGKELFPWVAQPELRRMVYSYNVTLKTVNAWETTSFHPILLGMAEAWRVTGDLQFLVKGLEQLQAFKAQGKMEFMDTRVECQHFYRAVLDALKLYGITP